jgi:hypothetical protein
MTQIATWSDYSSWPVLLISILLVDIVVLFLVRYVPLGSAINTWYDRFGLLAVFADVLSIALGFAVARWIYSTWFASSGLLTFFAILVGFQCFHDILFYFGIIQPIPRGTNAMIDVFKQYGTEGGAGIIAVDSSMMLASAAIFLGLERLSPSTQWFIGIFAVYTMSYILYTKRGG